MFGGPPFPPTDQPTENREPVGDYKLTHQMATVGERLFAEPGRIVELDMECPACGGGLVGRANKYTRSVTVWCTECSFRVSR